MRQGQIGMTLDVAHYETVMEGENMRAVVLTLEQGQNVPGTTTRRSPMRLSACRARWWWRHARRETPTR
jgi:hypothetical protein